MTSAETISLTDKTKNAAIFASCVKEPESKELLSSITIDTLRNWQFSDMQNAELFLKFTDNNYFYNTETKKWFIWKCKFWQPDVKLQRQSDINKLIQLIKKIAVIDCKAYEIDLQNRLLKQSLKLQFLLARENLLELAKCKIIKPINELDSNDDLINLQNGTFDLKLTILKPHNSTDYLTKICDYDYVQHAKCDLWETFLNRIFSNDKDLIRFIQKSVGYTLTMSTVEQKFFFLYGFGRNGKSVFLDILTELLGNDDYSCKWLSDYLTSEISSDKLQAEKARLVNKRLLIANETEENKRLAESKIKELTGDSIQTARFLYSESFSFTAKYKLWLSGNHKPIVYGSDLGIWRRIFLIPFNVCIPEDEVDKDLTSKLKLEISGIFNWAIEGLKLWRSEGLQPVPFAINSAGKSYKTEMDFIARFLDECCVIGDANEVKHNDLYISFDLWLTQSGEKLRVTKNTFGRKIKERGFVDMGSINCRIWLGLGLKQ